MVNFILSRGFFNVVKKIYGCLFDQNQNKPLIKYIQFLQIQRML
ncbi:hypothetical protein pb186bvf_007948 [Paramecium bursaria]